MNKINKYSIYDYLKSIGADPSFSARKLLAHKFGITNYTGTSAQNLKLLSIVKNNQEEELFKNSDVVGTVQFTEEDCVRNPIIPYLLSKIKEIE